MKRISLLLAALFGIMIFSYGCAKSVLQSSRLPDAASAKGTQFKMVYCLPKGMIHFRRQPAGGGVEVTVETVYVPDPEKYYTLEYLPNRTYEENIAVSVSEEMLLKKIDISSKPRIGEILMKVFELGREIAKFSVLPSPPGLVGVKVTYCDVMIDPKLLLDKSSGRRREFLKQRSEQLNSELERIQREISTEQQIPENETSKLMLAKLNIDKRNKENEIDQLKTDANPGSELGKICSRCGIDYISLKPLFPQADWDWLHVSPPSGGIKYRPLLPYRLEIQLPDNLIIKTVYLPNEAPVITLDVNRPAFADQVTTLTFEKGVLTQADLSRPSETLAFLKIPVDLVRAIVGLPMDLIKFRVENIQQSNALLQAQIDELRYKQTLGELRQKGQ